MALHKDFPKDKFQILDPAIRWFPAEEDLRKEGYEKLLPPFVLNRRSGWMIMRFTACCAGNIPGAPGINGRHRCATANRGHWRRRACALSTRLRRCASSSLRLPANGRHCGRMPTNAMYCCLATCPSLWRTTAWMSGPSVNISCSMPKASRPW